MAAKRGVEGVKALMVTAYENAYGASLLGGTILVVATAVAAAISHSKDLRRDLALVQKDLELAGMKARKDLEAARMEALRDVETARRETAEKFLEYGFTQEYSNYQKLLKLGYHEKGDGK